MRSRFLLSLFAFIMAVAIFAGCSSTPTIYEGDNYSPNVDSGNYQSETTVISTPEPESELSIEFVSEKLILETRGLTLSFAAEIKNTSDKPIEFDKLTLELENAQGELIEVVDYIDVYPEVILPGEIGYVFRSVLHDSDDDNIDLTDEFKYVLRYELDTAVAPDLPFEITQVNLTEKSGIPQLVGRIKNNSDTDYDYIIVAVPVFSSEGDFIGIFSTYVDVPANSEVGFDETIMNGDFYADHTGDVLGNVYFYPSALT